MHQETKYENCNKCGVLVKVKTTHGPLGTITMPEPHKCIQNVYSVATVSTAGTNNYERNDSMNEYFEVMKDNIFEWKGIKYRILENTDIVLKKITSHTFEIMDELGVVAQVSETYYVIRLGYGGYLREDGDTDELYTADRFKDLDIAKEIAARHNGTAVKVTIELEDM